MTTHRPYNPESNFKKVNQFLYDCYEPENADGNWTQPIWDYSYHHPNMELDDVDVWEDNGTIVAATIFETKANDICLCALRDFYSLRPKMLEVSEAKLARLDGDGNNGLRVFVHEADREQGGLLQKAGCNRIEKRDRTMSWCEIPSPDSEIAVADSFVLRSLGEVNDLRKVNRITWRGVNHPGEAPEDNIPYRRRMQSSLSFRLDCDPGHSPPQRGITHPTAECGMMVTTRSATSSPSQPIRTISEWGWAIPPLRKA